MNAKEKYELFQAESLRKDTESNPDFVYKPRRGDVIIFGPMKSGTTWLSQILHQIRTKGDTSFDKHYKVVWYIQRLTKAYFNLNAEQGYNPRLYKCHQPMTSDIYEEVKHVIIVRDPYDTAYSATKFLYRMMGYDEDTDDETAAFYIESDFVNRKDDYFHFFQSWWPHRNRSNVFWLFYEDMKKDLKAIVKQLAEFIDVETEQDELERVYQMCSFEFMSANGEKFEPNIVSEYNSDLGTSESWKPCSIVRKNGGQIGQGTKYLGPKLRNVLDCLWSETMEKNYGYLNYAQLYRENCRFK